MVIVLVVLLTIVSTDSIRQNLIVPAKIRSISDSDEMTVDEPQTPAVITFDPRSTGPITVCDINTEIFYFGTTDDEGNDITDQMLTVLMGSILAVKTLVQLAV